MKDQFQITIDGREWDTLHARDSFGTKMNANTEIHLGSGRRKSTRGRTSSASSPSVANESPNGQNLLGDALPEASKTGEFDPFSDGAKTNQPSNNDGFGNTEAVFPENDDFNTTDGFSPTAAFPPPATQSSATAAFPPPTASNDLASLFSSSPAEQNTSDFEYQAKQSSSGGSVDVFSSSDAFGGDLLQPTSASEQRGSLTASDLSNLYASTNNTPGISGMAPGAQAPPPNLSTAALYPPVLPMASPTKMTRGTPSSTLSAGSSSGSSIEASGDNLVDLGSLSINEGIKSNPSASVNNFGSSTGSVGSRKLIPFSNFVI